MAEASQSISLFPPPNKPPSKPFPEFTGSQPRPTIILFNPALPFVKSIFCPFTKLIAIYFPPRSPFNLVYKIY